MHRERGRVLILGPKAKCPVPRAKVATPPPMTTPETVRIQIGNLSGLTTEAALHTLFARYGLISGYDRPVNPASGVPGTIAYIEMVAEEAEKAIPVLDGSTVDGQEIRVAELDAKPARAGAAKPKTASAKATASKAPPSRSARPAAKAAKTSAAAKPATKLRSMTSAKSVATSKATKTATSAKSARPAMKSAAKPAAKATKAPARAAAARR